MGRTGIGVLCMWLCCAIPISQSQLVNVARGKTYSQSSYDAYNYPSSHAANGNTGGTSNSNNCIGTTNTPGLTDFTPWWQVDLGRKYTVYNITVWARAGYVGHLYPLNITVDGQQCVRATSTGSRERSLSCTSPITGRVVRLTRGYRKTGTGSLVRAVPLNLCEVQIWSTCQDGEYNSGTTCVPCSSTCKNRQCNSDTGRCDNCNVGSYKSSTYCVGCNSNCMNRQCDSENGCNTGWYGDRCDSKCSDRTSRCTQCARDGGQCTACSGHFKPPQCTECNSGYYKSGISCVACNSNCVNKECNAESGRCTKGCNTGWYGDRCDSNCSDRTSRCTQCARDDGQCTACSGLFKPPQCTDCDCGYYESGTSCVACNSNCVNKECNAENGRCTKGCNAGWYGHRCDSNCSTLTPRCTQCVQDDGQCTVCSGHFEPPQCTDCADGYYKNGTSCIECRCDKDVPCNKTTGQCAECSAGGNLCDQAAQTAEESSSAVVAVVVPVLLVIIIAVVVGIVLFVVFRRRRQRANKNGATTSEATGLPLADITDANSNDAQPSNTRPTSGAGGKKKNKPPSAAKPHKRTAVHTSRENPEEPENLEVEEPVYGNDPKFFKTPKSLVLSQLQEAVADRLRGDTLAQEFGYMEAVKGQVNNGQRQENYKKNRFNNILPYDKNRIQLDQVDGDDASDYINASFIKGFQREKGYIAAQGPKQNTLDDFWRMVWQEKVTDIVMLTNVKEGNKTKCIKYWPAEGATIQTRHMEVTGDVGDVETRAHYVIRTFDVKHKEGKEKRQVKQYHYISWTDHEVPVSTPLINFLRYVRARAARLPSAPPLLVHCSAGVGRTGTLVALDIAIDEAEQSSEVNLFSIVDRLRDDRSFMVQNKAQYVFLHEAFVEAYIGRDTRIEVAAMNTILPAFVNRSTPNARVDAEYEMLSKMRHWPKAPSYTMANMPENTAKNRNPNVLPDDNHLVYITQHVRGRNQYINGVSVATFLHHRGGILTQLPLPDTVIDLWRLVDGSDVKLIVSLGDIEEQQDMRCYWPKEKAKPLETGSYVIKMKSLRKIGSALWSYTLTVDKDGSTKQVRVLHYKSWTGECADDTAELILLLTTMQEAEKKTGGDPVIIQCIDGSLRSGVLCALWDVVNRMTHDEELDVYLAARMVIMARPEAFVSVEQYRFCYEVAQQINSSNNVYSNM